MAKQILSDKTLRSVNPATKTSGLMIVVGFIYSLKPMARSGGDLITVSKASAKPYRWVSILSLV